MPNIVEITVRSIDATKPVMDAVEAEFKASGKRAADNFTTDASGRLHDARGRFAASGSDIADAVGEGVEKDLPGKFEKPVEESGKRAAKKAGNGMSPLLLSAFTSAATLGPVALIAGAGVAVAGIAALVGRSNAGVAAEYQALGHDISNTLITAVAPFTGDIEKSINILDQGLTTVGPELKNVFAAAAPYSEDIAKSLVSIVQQALPGFAAGLREIAPIMQVLDTVTGDIGTAVGGFVQELGTGSSGAAVGLKALGDALSHILPDVGQILGALSNGLGPALRDILTVATPVAGALAGIVSAFPPHVIEVAAVATAALFAAFKIGAIAGVVAEGMTFVEFLQAAATAEGAMTLATGAATAATTALGTAIDVALGPLGIAVVAYAAVKQSVDALSGKDSGGGLGGIVRRQQEAAKAAKEHSDALAAAVVTQDSFSTALLAAADAAGDSAKQNATATLAALGLTDGTSDLTTNLYNTLQAFAGATGASNAYKGSLDALYNKYASYSQAQANFTEQLDAATKSLTAGKDAVNLNSEAGAKNFTVLNQLSQANEQVAESFIAQGGSVSDANRKLQAGALAIDNMARKAGFSAGQVAELNRELYGTANIKDIHVNVGANTSAAIGAVRDTLRYIDNQVAYIQVQTVGGSTGGHQLLAHGGAVGASHAAEGGPRGNVVTVGEHGIEDVQLPAGSTVFSHEDTMTRRSAQIGDSRALQIEWVGGNAGDEFLTWLRKSIRVRYGAGADSVQKALGQTF